MKAVLVIDVPEECGNCPCYNDEHSCCQFDGTRRIGFYSPRPSWCPLKPMPPKHTSLIENSYAEGRRDGWNACLDEITGETE